MTWLSSSYCYFGLAKPLSNLILSNDKTLITERVMLYDVAACVFDQGGECVRTSRGSASSECLFSEKLQLSPLISFSRALIHSLPPPVALTLRWRVLMSMECRRVRVRLRGRAPFCCVNAARHQLTAFLPASPSAVEPCPPRVWPPECLCGATLFPSPRGSDGSLPGHHPLLPLTCDS